jgi:hypothetical protein
LLFRRCAVAILFGILWCDECWWIRWLSLWILKLYLLSYFDYLYHHHHHHHHHHFIIILLLSSQSSSSHLCACE